MKKTISVLLALICFCMIFCFTVSADENIGVLKADRVTAKVGDEVVIPVSLVEHDGVCIIAVTVKYDPKALEVKNIDYSASDYFGYTVNAKTEGEVIVLMDGKALINIKEDIKLFELKLKVKKDANPGRTLVRVLCEEGMATRLRGSGSTMVPVAFAPATSTGAVTILCSEHVFSTEKSDGGYQCSKCGAVKKEDGNVSVESTQGLPEIDVSSQEASVNNSNTEIKTDEKTENNDKETKVKFVYFIPLIVALVIIGGTLIFVIVKRNKK